MWTIDRRRFGLVVGLALVASALLQASVYARFGGVLGYIQAYEDASELWGQEGHDVFEGMGRLFLFSECFPVLALMAFAVYARGKWYGRSWPVLALVLLTYFLLTVLFGGLRGGRSHTVFALFSAVGIIHFWLRPVLGT